MCMTRPIQFKHRINFPKNSVGSSLPNADQMNRLAPRDYRLIKKQCRRVVQFNYHFNCNVDDSKRPSYVESSLSARDAGLVPGITVNGIIILSFALPRIVPPISSVVMSSPTQRKPGKMDYKDRLQIKHCHESSYQKREEICMKPSSSNIDLARKRLTG